MFNGKRSDQDRVKAKTKGFFLWEALKKRIKKEAEAEKMPQPLAARPVEGQVHRTAYGEKDAAFGGVTEALDEATRALESLHEPPRPAGRLRTRQELERETRTQSQKNRKY